MVAGLHRAVNLMNNLLNCLPQPLNVARDERRLVVCVYAYIYIYTYVRNCTHNYMHVYLSICVCIYIYIQVLSKSSTAQDSAPLLGNIAPNR